MGCNTWGSVKDHLFPSQYAQWESCIQDLRVHWGKKDRPIISENDLSLQHDHFAFLVQALKDMHFLIKDQDANVLTVQCALKTLQAITGLPVTGLLDPVTVDVLNGKNQILIEKIQKTQKEWQKIGPLPERYILCNIPSFTLDVFDKGVSVLHSRVMGGTVD